MNLAGMLSISEEEILTGVYFYCIVDVRVLATSNTRGYVTVTVVLNFDTVDNRLPGGW